jgi:hypothetical protein
MHEDRLHRISRDVAALNTLALSRLRALINEDPMAAADRYGLSVITAQRLGRLPYAALSRLGDITIPLFYADTSDIPRLVHDATQSLGKPPGLCPTFSGGSDPDLARVYLQTVREDAWRYDVAAAVRWSWPLSHIRSLVDVPVSGLLHIADALRMRMTDGKMMRKYLEAVEASPLEPIPPHIRIGVLTMLGELPAPMAAA